MRSLGVLSAILICPDTASESVSYDGMTLSMHLCGRSAGVSSASWRRRRAAKRKLPWPPVR